MALIVVCGTMLATAAAVAAFAAETTTEDLPVAGGLAALAEVAEVSPVPDRARFVAELARVIYSSPATGPYSNEPVRRRIDAFFAEARQRAAGSRYGRGRAGSALRRSLEPGDPSSSGRSPGSGRRDPGRPLRGASVLRPRGRSTTRRCGFLPTILLFSAV